MIEEYPSMVSDQSSMDDFDDNNKNKNKETDPLRWIR